MSRIAIIAAFPGELKPLVGANGSWHRSQPNIWTGSIAGHEAIAIAGGIGAAAASRAVDQALSHSRPDALVSYGWAGAITCAVKPPDAFAISEVIDHCSGQRFATRSPEGLRLITLDHVAGPNEKRPLAEKHRAVLVDMEAAAVARLAVEHGIAFYCFKAISDGYTDRLPDMNAFIEEGRLCMSSFLAYTALRPIYWPSLMRLGKNSTAAATRLAQSFSKSLPTTL